MRDLNRYVVRKYSCDWCDVGLELGLELSALSTIERDNPHDNVICFQRTLDMWLKSNDDATWKTLEIALTNVNRANLELLPVGDVYSKDIVLLEIPVIVYNNSHMFILDDPVSAYHYVLP